MIVVVGLVLVSFGVVNQINDFQRSIDTRRRSSTRLFFGIAVFDLFFGKVVDMLEDFLNEQCSFDCQVTVETVFLPVNQASVHLSHRRSLLFAKEEGDYLSPSIQGPTIFWMTFQNRFRSRKVNPNSFLNKCSTSSRSIDLISSSLIRCPTPKK